MTLYECSGNAPHFIFYGVVEDNSEELQSNEVRTDDSNTWSSLTKLSDESRLSGSRQTHHQREALHALSSGALCGRFKSNAWTPLSASTLSKGRFGNVELRTQRFNCYRKLGVFQVEKFYLLRVNPVVNRLEGDVELLRGFIRG